MIEPNPPATPKIAVVFYQTGAGTEPVRDWLLTLPEPERREIGRDLMRVQWRWPVGMPLVRPLGGGLLEVRTSLPGNRIARVLFSFQRGELYALHGFIKKSQATPAADLGLALARKKEIDNG